MSALMEFLQRNATNKRVLAALRCALVESTEMRAWPLLARFDGIGPSQRARAVRTVAGLFAMHPDSHCDSGNMGTVCRALCREDERPWETSDSEGKAVAPGPMGRRFMALLNADREEICRRVSLIVAYAGSQGVGVNYAALEKDLAEWPRAREAWASAFWAPQTNDEAGGDDA